MVYTSLKSPEKDYTYDLHIAHLYGDLMNTYGDNGNILMLKYVAEKLGARVQVDIVSLTDEFDKNFYDIAFSVVVRTMNNPFLQKIYQLKRQPSRLHRKRRCHAGYLRWLPIARAILHRSWRPQD